MTSDNKALPWFPITSEYIDYYYDSVIKYIREVRFSNSSGYADDSSYLTTVELLSQWAEQKFSEYLDKPLFAKKTAHHESLDKDLRLISLAALLSCLDDRPYTQMYLVLTAYLLSLLKPELSEITSGIVLRIIRSEKVVSVGFTMDDILYFDARSFLDSLSRCEVSESRVDKWYENHGAVKVDKTGVFLYDMTREFAELKLKLKGTFKSVASIEDNAVCLLQDKKEKGAFKLSSFINTVQDLAPGEVRIKKSDYQDGDELTVKVISKTYDSVRAESIDPAFNVISGDILITSGSNVRGIYPTDIARNVSAGTLLNVKWEDGAFSIDDTILDFICDKYWVKDEDVQQYSKMKAILLFPHEKNIIRNTWLTEYGFLVRTGFEDFPRYSYKILEVDEYDDKLDFFFASVSNEEPEDSPFLEQYARDSFLHRFISEIKPIESKLPPVKEVRLIDKCFITFLHRILGVKLKNAVSGVDLRESYINVCSAMAVIAGDNDDFRYYSLLAQYLHSLEAFARERFASISALDFEQSVQMSMVPEAKMLDVLREYGNEEESSVLAEAIIEAPDQLVSDVAKLVQASNRFIGSTSISDLREDLHKEICIMLSVADAIESNRGEEKDRFPLPPESDSVEHKMSWIYDNATSLPNETAQSAKIFKTICAFMNRLPEQGDAHLYIGADEKRRVINGVQADIDFLVSKGELPAEGDLNDEFSRHVLESIKKRFPDDHTLVHPDYCCDGKVLDLCVSPGRNGIVYLQDVAYYRYGSSSRVMTDSIREEISIRKASYRDNYAEKVDAVKRAINSKTDVVLRGYDSSNSNTTGVDRILEVFSFVDNGRFDAVWAFDFTKDRKNKVFLLKRAESVELVDKKWSNERHHAKYPLDMFGFFGNEKIPFSMVLKSTRARNNLIEQYPDTEQYLTAKPGNTWYLSGILSTQKSLSVACAFYLGLADEVDISSCQPLKEIVNQRLTDLVSRL